MPPPLLVHLVFHPESDEARALAHALYVALNEDGALPGLRIPTVLAREDELKLPPVIDGLNEAERSFVVLLADDDWAIERALPPGRRSWGEFAGDLWEKCQNSRHSFFPIGLSENAWPLDDRLKEVNFRPAHREPRENRTHSVITQVLVQLARFLMHHGEGKSVPVRLFLSHAKADIDKEPKVFKALTAHLDATHPVKTWVDSAEIEGGSKFSDAIKEGAQDSQLLVLLTSSYSTRVWCRREVLLAKEAQRPIVVIDALQGHERRSFPYLGNAPVVAWASGGAVAAVELVLKETIRRAHEGLLLKRQSVAGDVVLTAAPEAAKLLHLPHGKSVLYPDPPLGTEELNLLAPLKLKLSTPLQRAGKKRTLKGRTIALSISESDDLRRFGVLIEHLDAVLIEVSRQLLVRGATLAYGGHLGSEGYTTRLFELVQAHNEPEQLAKAERIVNFVGWPTPFPKAAQAKYQGAAKFIRVPRPKGLEVLDPTTFVAEPTGVIGITSGLRRYAWALGMTAMRAKQVAAVKARIVLGGKVGPTDTALPEGGRAPKWYSGRIPGVIEEAVLSLRAHQPLYICGGFGGAAAAVAELLQGRVPRELTWEYQKNAPYAPEMKALYEQHGVPWEDYPQIAAELKGLGLGALAKANKLSRKQNLELLHSRDPARIVELILIGLAAT